MLGVRDLANILVVEDEEDIRKIVQISLEMLVVLKLNSVLLHMRHWTF